MIQIKVPNNYRCEISEQIAAHFRINIFFYVVLFVVLYTIIDNKKSVVISFVMASLIGYMMHVISHDLDFPTLKKILLPNSRVETFFQFVLKQFIDLIESHDKIHHNSSINKLHCNIAKETSVNILIQGIIPFMYTYIFIVITSYIDLKIFAFWALLYTTVHIINYTLIYSKTHEEHHINKHTNYGYDIYDIIFKTKSNTNSIEDINHYSINAIIIGILFYLFQKY